MNTNNTKYEYKKHKIPKLRTEKIAYWVFCALITTETLKSRLWVSVSVSKLQPNTNMNNIWFSKITRIRIQKLFGFEKSPKYEYKYHAVLKNYPNTNIIRFENIFQK